MVKRLVGTLKARQHRTEGKIVVTVVVVVIIVGMITITGGMVTMKANKRITVGVVLSELFQASALFILPMAIWWIIFEVEGWNGYTIFTGCYAFFGFLYCFWLRIDGRRRW